MKHSEIKVGGFYLAKVGGKVTTVKVDKIENIARPGIPKMTRNGWLYHVTNLTTSRRTTFRSAAKFRSVATSVQVEVDADNLKVVDDNLNAVELAIKEGRLDDAERLLERSATPSDFLRVNEKTGRKVSQDEIDQVNKSVGVTVNPITGKVSALDKLKRMATVKPNKEAREEANPILPSSLTVLASSLSAAAHSEALSNGHQPSHIIVQARAGTGKTTTLVEGLKWVMGQSSSLTPSDQQDTVWREMAKSSGVRSVCFVAFNKSIATELQRRVPRGVDAMTMHSMGYKVVTKALGRLEPNQYVVQDIICGLLGGDIRDIRKTKPTVLKAAESLVSLCKMSLVHDEYPDDSTSLTTAWWNEQLDDLTRHYEVEMASENKDEKNVREQVYELVPKVLELCKQPHGRINFDDMIWLPVVLGLPVIRYDLLLVDEAQDLNRCQQALAKRAGKRLILVGDDKQAIYGFAGADAESMGRMSGELSSQESGCTILPLTVTRRCGHAIVEEARKLVPDFEAHPDNSEGRIERAKYSHRKVNGEREEIPWEMTYAPLVKAGDMVLCRCNAPLVSQCFRFLKRGIKATIQGRDIGKGLISLVNRMSKDGLLTVLELVAKLSDWHHAEVSKEQAKRNPDEAKIINLDDKYECLVCFTDGAVTVADVVRKIESVFTDDKDTPGIRLSSIHKAKGMEADNVFLLQPEGATCPLPYAAKNGGWQLEQEYNLLYVAITRAIHTLTYVS